MCAQVDERDRIDHPMVPAQLFTLRGTVWLQGIRLIASSATNHGAILKQMSCRRR